MSGCVAIIPARAGSKGIIDKNIIEFCGQPLITWSVRQALAARCVDEVYVSTDGEKIAAAAETAGARIIWRPLELAGDMASSEDALAHAMGTIRRSRELSAVVFLQATSPIRREMDIDQAYQKFVEEDYDSLFSMAVLEDACIWKERDGGYESLSYDYRNRGRRQEREPLYLENGSIYIFKPEVLEKYKNRLGGRIGTYEMPYSYSYEIDSREDVMICEHFMRKMLEENHLETEDDMK